MSDITIQSVVDGTLVDHANLEDKPSRTVYEEFCRQLSSATYGRLNDASVIVEPSGRRISYNQLYEIVEKFIHDVKSKLRNESITERPVAVFLPPGCARIAALLALNALRLPFVPLDTVQTADQRSFILDHSKAQAVIADSANAAILGNNTGAPILLFDTDCSKIVTNGRNSPLPSPKDELGGDRVCLTLYTSGSTGVPKGVCLTDDNLLNRLRWQWAELPFASDGSDVCLAKTNHLFVDSYTEILGSVLRLQRLVIVDPNAWRKSEAANVAALMSDAISDHKVTRLILVPSLLSAMLDLPNASERLASLRFVISSGEALPSELARRFFRTLANTSCLPRLANFYGSTEVTGDVTAAIFASEADVAARTFNGFLSIGRPVYNTSIYVCREDLPIPVPMGEVGHIYVSGDNVCKEFAGESKRAIDRFTTKPKCMSKVGIGNRLLSMGDIGRIVAGGELVYCGRGDSLVKIRGNRVSTTNVEDALKAIVKAAFDKKPAPQPPRCRVLAVEHQHSATFKLAAFYETWPDASFCLRPDNVRKALSDRLPHYALPELLLPIDIGAFPLQPHTGKTDQSALKRIAQEALAKSAEGVEETLTKFKINPDDVNASAVDAVRQVAASTLGLELDRVVMEATFFNQGGNSLSVIAAVVALNKVGFRNATAEMLLSPDNTLSDVARQLSEGYDKSSTESESLLSSNPLDNLIQKRPPSWIDYRNLTELTDSEASHLQKRIDYSFSVMGPLGKLLKLPNNAFSKMLTGEWKLYQDSGVLSFAAFDRRRSNGSSIIGAILCSDVTEKICDDSIWDGIEAVRGLLREAELPVSKEIHEKYAINGQMPKGTVVSYRMVYVEPNLTENEASSLFLELELELIRRAKKAGFKVILTKNASLATQAMERDILGYKERYSLVANSFRMVDGTQPYSHAPADYAILTMTLDL